MPNIYQMNAAGHDGGGNAFVNVQHFELSEAGSATGFEYSDALLSAWQSARLVAWLGALPSDAQLDFITARRVTGGGGPTATQIVNGPGNWMTGTSFSAALSVNLALIPVAGSNQIGHLYYGPIPTDGLNKDALLGPYLTALAAIATDLRTTLTIPGPLGTADNVIFHRKTLTHTLLDTVIIRPKVTAMNRRLLPVT